MVFAAGASQFTNTLLAIIAVLTACGCFLVGINLMSRGFVQATLRHNSIFTRGFASKNRLVCTFSGTFHAALSQSSDVTTVTLVRLADLGFITLTQACACVIGANIGTTITTFIVSLSALNLTPYFAFLAFIGAIPLLSKKKPLRIFGELVAGLGILFIGLQLLEANIVNPAFKGLIDTIFSSTMSPVLLLLIGSGLTAIVQSSSVVTCMVVFLVSANMLPISSALCLVAGANIGTCFTSWIASFGSGKTARQTAMFHTLFNIVGAAIFMTVMYTPINKPFISWVEGVRINAEFKIALFHLTFNLTAALVMIPLLRPAAWLSKKIVRH
jgi:phosphate:Na+ symporter